MWGLKYTGLLFMMGISEESQFEKEFRFLATACRRDVIHPIVFCLPVKHNRFHIIVKVELDMDSDCLDYVEVDLLVEGDCFIESFDFDTGVCAPTQTLICSA